MATYVNDLRLKEIGTGESSGTWGSETNVNLELIGEALGFGTEAITTNADTHTTTVADGSTDPGRAMYIKYTGTLDSACTITIAPNTMSRMHFIENGTSGSQNIIISQGTGANVTIPAGDTKAVYLDGAGSGAAVVDAFASLNTVDLKVEDDLTVTDDVSIGGALTLTGNGDFNGDLDVDGTTNLDVVDIDGAVDMASTLQVDGAITSSAGATITIADNSSALSLVSTDADNNEGPVLRLMRDSGSPADGDSLGRIYFSGDNDAGEEIQYVRFQSILDDASDGTEDSSFRIQTYIDGAIKSKLFTSSTETVFNDNAANVDFRVESDSDANMFFVDGGADTVGIGTGTPGDLLHVTNGDRSVDTRIRLDAFGQLPIFNVMYAAGTSSSPTAATSGTEIMRIASSPYDGSDYAQSAMNLRVVAEANFSSNSTPAFLAFDINNTTRLATEAMRLNSTGCLVISDTVQTQTNAVFEAHDGDNVTALSVQNNSATVTRGQDTTAGANFVLQANRGSLASPSNSNNGDNCGKILFRAYHTNGNYTSSIIRGFINGANGTNDMPGTMVFETAADGSATPTERVRINPDGQVSFGTSSPLAGSRIFTLASASTPYGITTQNDATTGTMFVMVYHSNGGSAIGSITTSNTATAFNTSSDYRLKENIQPLENGLERLNNLNPVKFDWKEDGTSSEGFMAHEAQEVFPDAVTGEKDGEEMQGMDYGRITPLLVKAIQEQQEQIEQLKTEIEKLH